MDMRRRKSQGNIERANMKTFPHWAENQTRNVHVAALV